jgi:hypothetical protein
MKYILCPISTSARGRPVSCRNGLPASISLGAVARVSREQVTPSRCPLLGFAMKSVVVEGQTIPGITAAGRKAARGRHLRLRQGCPATDRFLSQGVDAVPGSRPQSPGPQDHRVLPGGRFGRRLRGPASDQRSGRRRMSQEIPILDGHDVVPARVAANWPGSHRLGAGRRADRFRSAARTNVRCSAAGRIAGRQGALLIRSPYRGAAFDVRQVATSMRPLMERLQYEISA